MPSNKEAPAADVEQDELDQDEREREREREREQPRASREAKDDQSPLSAEPKRPAKKAKPKARTRTVREFQEPIPSREDEQRREDFEGDGHPEFDDESPLSAMADAQLAMTHVSRVGPGTGQGWAGGMNYDHGDGRGPQPVSKGPVGTFQKTKDLFEVVIAEAGGGRYRFVSRGEPPIEENLPGPPLPLPMEAQGRPLPQQAPMQDDRGEDDGYGGGGRWGQHRQPDPIDSMDPEVGIAPEELQQSSINGWFQNGANGRWLFYYNGVPGRPPRGSRPPAPAAGFGAAAAMTAGMYDHSGDDRLSRLEKMFEKLVEGGPTKADPRLERLERLLEEKKGNDAFATMMANQMTIANNAAVESQKQREHEYKMADLTAKADEAERKARIAADAEAFKKTRELEIEAIKAKADADKHSATKSAEAAEANAKAMIASNERIAQIQADANKQVLAAMSSARADANPIDTLTKGMEIAGNLMGGKSTAAEITTAISGAAERMIPAMADAYVAVRTNNPGAPGAPGVGGSSDDEMVGRFVTLIVTLYHKGTPPAEVPRYIGASCIVSGFDAAKLEPMLAMGTPTVIGAFLEDAAAKAQDENYKKKLLDAKAALTSAEGKLWFQGVRSAFAQARKGTVTAAPAAPQIPAGAGPSNPNGGPTPGKN